MVPISTYFEICALLLMKSPNLPKAGRLPFYNNALRYKYSQNLNKSRHKWAKGAGLLIHLC
jgi:hypothetical protein